MKILGGILPFIGFRETWISREDAKEFGVSKGRYDMKNDTVLCDALEIAWLGVGFTLWIREKA